MWNHSLPYMCSYYCSACKNSKHQLARARFDVLQLNIKNGSYLPPLGFEFWDWDRERHRTLIFIHSFLFPNTNENEVIMKLHVHFHFKTS